MKYFLSPFLLFLFSFSVECKSQSIEAITRFGDSLFLSRNYVLALNEYQRAYFFSINEQKIKLGGNIANCYIGLNDFQKARAFYDSVLFYSKNESHRIFCEFQKILCFMKEKNFGYALIKLNNLELNEDIQLQRKRDLYRGICCFGTGQYDESQKYFLSSMINTDTLRKLELQQLYAKQKVLKRPKSQTAILLSMIIPGTGQFYSGDIKDGLNSLLLLGGIFYLGTIVSSSGLVLIVPVFCKYYLGGIVHSKQIAERKRTEKKYVFYQNIMEIILK